MPSTKNPPPIRPCSKITFFSHLEFHVEIVSVFTDSSKKIGLKASTVFPDCTFSYTLLSYSTIFSAELIAVILALSRIFYLSKDVTYVISSDSKSALMTLNNRSARSLLVSLIKNFHFQLHSRKKTVRFCWVPYHVDVLGSEKADMAANRAASTRTVCGFPLPLSIYNGCVSAPDPYSQILFRLLACWEACWREDTRGAKL